MKRSKRLIRSLALILGALSLNAEPVAETQTAPTKNKKAKSAVEHAPIKDYVRLVEVGRRAQVQTSIVTLGNEDGVKVHLASAIHIGEKSYYEKLDKTFGKYDKLLYELVAGADEVDMGALKGNRGMQGFLAERLGLNFQLAHIDYEADNFVHADMTAQQFMAEIKERKASIFGVVIKAMQMEMEKQARGDFSGQINPMDLLGFFGGGQAANMRLKLSLAKQLTQPNAMEILDDTAMGDVLLIRRNQVALKTLKKTLRKHPDAKEIGIFYGAAHMPDLEARIIKKLGFKRTDSEWRMAWNMFIP